MHDLRREIPFAGLRPIGVGNGVVAVERTDLAIATVIARRDKSVELGAAVERNFGIVPPAGAKWAGNNSVIFLGTGPGKWLTISEAPNPDFVVNLATELQGLASVADQSGGLGVLRLTGSALLPTLEKGLQIDLAPGAFPANSVAVTSIAHIGATLWKVDEQPTIDVAVARSLAGSFQHWLEVSAAVYGLSLQRSSK
ncbi:MAG: sarcosine oxidase subunit gamma [Afipia sp.]